jgi:hypothetical protein
MKSVFRQGIRIDIGDNYVNVISIDDLIANKKALNTYKDLADAEELMKIKNTSK